MDNFTIKVAATRLGAACLGARSPWTNVAAAEANTVANTVANHALWRDNIVSAAGTGDARRRAAFRVLQPMSVQTTQLPQIAAVMSAELLPTTAMVTRKPETVHKTRINAGGYGAMGPHPERERLAS